MKSSYLCAGGWAWSVCAGRWNVVVYVCGWVLVCDGELGGRVLSVCACSWIYVCVSVV